ncbi:MAG: hypothetical protein GWO07_06240 [Candidatus Dadabacteria bacterium]|nr:hypothetical protein [Candidatus Dadabacteria bacterium]NIS08352.1 hypothetical protein [Candidatus Dadabacteria bacterium]NIY21872.1 hypothetical protein [Candidatus Dadabacteria bacterium]
MDSNPTAAIIGGIIGAVTGALVWTGVTIVLRQEFGVAAIAIGFITGFFVRNLGKGTTSIYGIMGALFTFLGCMVGKLFTVIYQQSRGTGISFTEALMDFDLSITIPLIEQTMQRFDYLFIATAAFTGYLFSIHKGKQMHFRRR